MRGKIRKMSITSSRIGINSFDEILMLFFANFSRNIFIVKNQNIPKIRRIENSESLTLSGPCSAFLLSSLQTGEVVPAHHLLQGGEDELAGVVRRLWTTLNLACRGCSGSTPI